MRRSPENRDARPHGLAGPGGAASGGAPAAGGPRARRKHGVRSGVELNGDFARALRQFFSRADEERNAGPTPVIDKKRNGREGVGLGTRIDAGLLAEPLVLPGHGE